MAIRVAILVIETFSDVEVGFPPPAIAFTCRSPSRILERERGCERAIEPSLCCRFRLPADIGRQVQVLRLYFGAKLASLVLVGKRYRWPGVHAHRMRWSS